MFLWDHFTPDMKVAAWAIVRHLGLSEACGFDFVLEEAPRRKWLICVDAFKGTE